MQQRDIQGKIDFVLDNLEKLNHLKRYSLEEFTSHFEHVDSAIYRLQTSIEALLDISRYIIASLGFGMPATGRGAIELLAHQGFLSASDVERYGQMVGFRNRVVHEYNRIDYQQLNAILQSSTTDLRYFLEQLLGMIANSVRQDELTERSL